MTEAFFISMNTSYLNKMVYSIFEHNIQKFDICLLVLYVKGAKNYGMGELNVGTHRNALYLS